MNFITKEIRAKSVLTKSGIPGADYCINPYIGCAHGCRYCYATFMKKYTGHTEPWGSFVDVKINTPEILQKQLRKASKGNVIISSVTDAYQPAESRWQLTRQCLEILLDFHFSVDILTKSPLVLRDISLIKKFENIEVGITITTDDDRIRKIFEPNAPPIEARISTLRKLFEHGIKTYAFIGPVLPMNPETLVKKIKPFTHYVFIDKMNYVSKTIRLYKQIHLENWLDKEFKIKIVRRLKEGLSDKETIVC